MPHRRHSTAVDPGHSPYPATVLECVPNVSEGRAPACSTRSRPRCGPSLLDVHVDPDHHRSVFTLAGPGRPTPTRSRALAGPRSRAAWTSPEHTGVHPRLRCARRRAVRGASTANRSPSGRRGRRVRGMDRRRRSASRCSSTTTPIRTGAPCPTLRGAAFAARAPDLGPERPHPGLGAVAVGARPPLVAVNCELDADDVAVARASPPPCANATAGSPACARWGSRWRPSAGRRCR